MGTGPVRNPGLITGRLIATTIKQRSLEAASSSLMTYLN